jgi:hypothetical protein
MPENFKIGTTLLGMTEIETLLAASGDLIPGEVFSPDWSFQPYAEVRELADGKTRGQGFPVVIWRWNQISERNRQVLRSFISSGLSAPIYIRTPTNEISAGARVWKSYLGVMKWTPEDEDKVAERTLGLVLTFTHLVEQ